jgi:hypothetical protein
MPLRDSAPKNSVRLPFTQLIEWRNLVDVTGIEPVARCLQSFGWSQEESGSYTVRELVDGGNPMATPQRTHSQR